MGNETDYSIREKGFEIIKLIMSVFKNLQMSEKNITYGIIEMGADAKKLSMDFCYIFENRLHIGEILNGDEESINIQGKNVYYICCTYDRKDAKKKLHRIAEDTIVKVYRSFVSMDAIEKEKALSRWAFVKGLPTAISFDIVSSHLFRSRH